MVNRRQFLISLTAASGTSLAGCGQVTDRLPEIPVSSVQVVNLSGEKIAISLTVDHSSNSESTTYSKNIGSNNGESVRFSPDVENALEYEFYLNINSKREGKVTGGELKKEIKKSNEKITSKENCIEIRWLVDLARGTDQYTELKSCEESP